MVANLMTNTPARDPFNNAVVGDRRPHTLTAALMLTAATKIGTLPAGRHDSRHFIAGGNGGRRRHAGARRRHVRRQAPRHGRHLRQSASAGRSGRQRDCVPAGGAGAAARRPTLTSTSAPRAPPPPAMSSSPCCSSSRCRSMAKLTWLEHRRLSGGGNPSR